MNGDGHVESPDWLECGFDCVREAWLRVFCLLLRTRRRASLQGTRRMMHGRSGGSWLTGTALLSHSLSRRTSVSTGRGSGRCPWFATMQRR